MPDDVVLELEKHYIGKQGKFKTNEHEYEVRFLFYFGYPDYLIKDPCNH